jgi:hypothetical protein
MATTAIWRTYHQLMTRSRIRVPRTFITLGRLWIRADVTLALTLRCTWRQPSEVQTEETKVSVRIKSFWTLQQAQTERAKWIIARYTLRNDVKLNVDTRADYKCLWNYGHCIAYPSSSQTFGNRTLPFEALVNGGGGGGDSKQDVKKPMLLIRKILYPYVKHPTWRT